MIIKQNLRLLKKLFICCYFITYFIENWYLISCLGMTCSPLARVSDGEFTNSHCNTKPIGLGGVCNVTCNIGYTHAPEFTGYLCTSNNQWVPDPYSTLCRRECLYLDKQ